ncbi:MAG: acetate--CoA ligase family protein [Acidimicrobiales bacterium]
MASSLTRLLEASSVAVVGASERAGSVGETTLRQLVECGFEGEVFPVNPRHRSLRGLSCYPSLEELPVSVDLAVIALPDALLEEQLSMAARLGVGSAVIFASAFDEPAEGEPRLTERLAAIANEAGMALCGANCMGFVHPAASLEICGFSLPAELGPGPICLLSHSGSSFSALLHNDRGLKFNLAVSSGQELVTTAADYVSYGISMEGTAVVGLVVEQLRDVPRFSEVAREASERDIPIVALKVGADPRTADLVSAHSGALAGDDGAYEAFFDAYGIHRVRDLCELADTLELFAAGRRAAVGGLAAVTDSGGERALLIDLAGEVALAAPNAATKAELASVLDRGLPVVNPLDAWGTGADSDNVFKRSLRALHDDPGTGALLFAVDLTAASSESYAAIAIATSEVTEKPFAVLSHYPGGIDRAAAARLRRAGVPLLEGTISGLAAVRHLFDHRDLRARPQLDPPAPVAADVRRAWQERLSSGDQLGEAEALSLLADWGLPVARTLPAASEAEALAAAGELGWPVAVKTAAPGLGHKTEQGGVALGVTGDEALRQAYRKISGRLGPLVDVQRMVERGIEIALGVVEDADFGPLVVVAAGGTLVELLGDRQLALAPLDDWRARRLLQRLRCYPLLRGFRGSEPVDEDALVAAVVRLSALACDLAGSLGALDVNPLVVGPRGCVAVDALVVPPKRST